MSYIDPMIFLISLCMGLFYIYITTPEPEIILKYPTPFNAGKITYKDTQGQCYKYGMKKVSCPTNPEQIKKYSNNIDNGSSGSI